jgi:hypothetical protein
VSLERPNVFIAAFFDILKQQCWWLATFRAGSACRACSMTDVRSSESIRQVEQSPSRMPTRIILRIQQFVRSSIALVFVFLAHPWRVRLAASSENSSSMSIFNDAPVVFGFEPIGVS